MVGAVMLIPMDVETPSLIDRAMEEATHLARYDVLDDGMDGCCVCFTAQEYATGENAWLLECIVADHQHFSSRFS
jgi:hypothetical protein